MSEAERREGSAIFEFAVRHPVGVTMVFLAALVFGWVSYERLPIELMPDIAYPTVTVRTGFEGAAPQEVESQVSRPIEESLATLDGLVHMESRSRAGSSDVVLGFDWGTDMGAATQSIRENLQITFLPDQADRPLILRYDPSLDPFLRLILAVDRSAVEAGEEPPPEGDAALFVLRQIGETEVKRALESLEGVAAVRVLGGLEREIRVEVREDWMAARKVTLEQVQAALASENINLAGGSILQGDVEYLIRTLNEYTSMGELRSLQIRRSDGVLVPLTDVAVLTEAHRDREVVTRLDAGEAVELEVFKEADANVVEVARAVRQLLDGNGVPEAWGGVPGMRDQLPPGVVLTELDNQAEYIEEAIDNLRETVVSGGLLAVLGLFLFLRDFRSTAIIGVIIPMSLVIGMAPLYLQGISLNLMTLGGLALSGGILIDNAVVVLESIQRWRDDGLDRVEACVRGTADVAAAVAASTFTCVAVFLPISFLDGVAGELFGDLSLAVVSSQLASLGVALFAVPMLAALEAPDAAGTSSASLLRRAPDQSRTAWLGALVGGAVSQAVRPGMAELQASIDAMRARRWRLVLLPYVIARFLLDVLVRGAVMATSLGGAVALWLVFSVGGRVIGPLIRLALWGAERFQAVYDRFADRYTGWLLVAIGRPGMVLGISLGLFLVSVGALRSLGSELVPELHQGRFTAEVALPVGTPLARTARVVAEAERIVATHPDVATVYSTIGVDRRADARSDEGEHTARLRVQLTEGGDLAAREARVVGELRDAIAVAVPELRVKMAHPAMFSTSTPIEVVVFGWELDALRTTADRLVEVLGAVPGLRDVRSSLAEGYPEVRIAYDRDRLHRLGLDAATVAARVRDKVQGVEATQIHQEDQRVSLRVQLVEEDRGTLAQLRSINVNPALEPMIPLDAVAEVTEAIGPSEIRRVDQQRAVVLSANLEGFDLGSAVAGIEAALRDFDLPDGMSWIIAGQSREMQESLASLQFALALAVFLVYVIMAITFENVIHPFVIMFSVPLSVVGAVAALFVTGTPISVVAVIGVIVLAGVVVNNAIVLVDAINFERATGLEREAALRKAAATRLRPILITAGTTVMGLLPLAFGFGAGAEMQGPLAITVIGGMVSSTLLTLFVIPVVYRALDRSVDAAVEPDRDAEAQGATP